MQMFDRHIAHAGAVFALLACCGSAQALDENAPPASRKVPAEIFLDVRSALRAGVRDLNAGDKEGAVRALQYAAQGGNMAAQFKLGRMFADGDGVPHDDFKAFQYFTSIANGFADESVDSVNAGVVSKAFVALGSYYLLGIPQSPVKPNAPRAMEMFQYAATYFGNADAQYNLGRMHLDGVVGAKDPSSAAKWLGLAAQKHHVYAQAVLGQMLFSGDGVPRQGPLGLMWLSLARDGADAVKDQWILDLQAKALAAASEDERKLAENYQRRQRRASMRNAPAAQTATAPAATPAE